MSRDKASQRNTAVIVSEAFDASFGRHESTLSRRSSLGIVVIALLKQEGFCDA